MKSAVHCVRAPVRGPATRFKPFLADRFELIQQNCFHSDAAARSYYHLTSTDPHVNPPPMASRSTRCPCLIRPSLQATSNASGIDAAEVFPWS